ncbi:hypothetical protein Q764_10735 [Flavobacterium suncheonense GH29-5 = DSM 17707]|uniref:DUF4595 domain-containing protein n=2 Tax=Flavobacterium suncheonense TaxID=350894 RepID=A0A0A2MKN2_9FLAO|nr:hypothetical protein Q764_10735 [Flavobacterium suncheonense GH29-5 = DSM 17707]
MLFFFKIYLEKMKKLIYAFSALALLFASCSSDNDSSSEDTSGPVLLKKLIETDFNGDVYTTDYFYNGNKLIKTVNDDGTYQNITYTGNLITKMEFFSETDQLEQTDLFVYNENEQLVNFQRLLHNEDLGFKEVYVYDASGNVAVTYYDGDLASQTNETGTGNVTFLNGEISVMTDMDAGVTKTYTYDTKNTPFKNVLGMGKLSFYDSGNDQGINHNVVMLTKSDGESVTSTYTYNSSDYPVTCVDDDSVLGNISYQFFYE